MAGCHDAFHNLQFSRTDKVDEYLHKLKLIDTHQFEGTTYYQVRSDNER